MNALHNIAALLERHVVKTADGKTTCAACGAFTVAAELHHDTGCEYVAAVKLLARIDPPHSGRGPH